MLNKLRSIDIRNLLERALWTFLEGFLTGISVDGIFGLAGKSLHSFLLATLIGGIAAGISAVKSLVVDIIGQKLDEKNALENDVEILPEEPNDNIEGAYTDADE